MYALLKMNSTIKKIDCGTDAPKDTCSKTTDDKKMYHRDVTCYTITDNKLGVVSTDTKRCQKAPYWDRETKKELTETQVLENEDFQCVCPNLVKVYGDWQIKNTKTK